MSQSNGGISQTSRISAYPMVNTVTGQAGLYAFDPTLGFNDANNPANYFFRIEEVIVGATITVSHIIVTYRDLGLVTLTFTLTGNNDLQQIVSNSVIAILGNRVATGRIMTINTIGLTLTGQNLQLSVSKAPGAGNEALIKVVMIGTVATEEGR